MPTIAPIVGYCDGLGCLYCMPCAREYGVFGEPVYADSVPHNAESCERCRRPLLDFSGTESSRG